MRIFLTQAEHTQILLRIKERDPVLAIFYDALRQRVYARVERKSLAEIGDTTAWYYPAAEYLSDAAMLYALKPEAALAQWLRSMTLELARAPIYDWVGPAFRSHAEPLTGHLETAHLCWALASVVDLAPEVFQNQEEQEVRVSLREKGLTLCQRWLAANSHLANWRGILTSGVVVAAAVLGDEPILDEYLPLWKQCSQAFQPDGSYAESLQYGNYLAFALMLAYESVVRKYPEKVRELPIESYGKGLSWITQSMFYDKPAEGWGSMEPRARAANFNDSSALFRPSADLLLHLSARLPNSLEGGLAQGLFDNYYAPVPYQGPHDLATFGMVNDWGFLTLPLLLQATEGLSPKSADLPLTQTFSNGHAFMRDAWPAQTIVAINGGGEGLCGPGHLHGDLNSFIVAHRGERLLTDPGHSCYRNLIHGLESSSQTHSTCTFLVEKDALGLQEDLAKATLLEQNSVLPRRIISPDGTISEPINRGNKKLIAQRSGLVSVIGAEVAAAYGVPLIEFSRLWLLAGSNVLFVVDTIEATQPITTIWNWLVNNRDSRTVAKNQDNCLEVKRNEAGMKLFHTGKGGWSHPVYGYVHDAYHVEPNQRGEGKPGSGLVYRFTESEPVARRTFVHAIALDRAAFINSWQLQQQENTYALSDGKQCWTLTVETGSGTLLELMSENGTQWVVEEQDRVYQLNQF
ncbi:heparinase II/III domain-containing protein [Arundinibacter roseus]|uniref:Heparinase II/III-like C-terminal domain-containing protein n=1 Tax=Arundinibacter roseus TaxID=2070510 RepID=A0A4R4KKL2_9BACT|nr:heparinase II/III family protein [Arundinibacter roseus]TDB67526.1 hypothetical protein EZE20_06160 [Arundinibacter roseus]